MVEVVVLDPDERLLSLSEVAEYLKVNLETVRREIRRGNLPAICVGKAKRVCWPDLREYVREKRLHPNES